MAMVASVCHSKLFTAWAKRQRETERVEMHSLFWDHSPMTLESPPRSNLLPYHLPIWRIMSLTYGLWGGGIYPNHSLSLQRYRYVTDCQFTDVYIYSHEIHTFSLVAVVRSFAHSAFTMILQNILYHKSWESTLSLSQENHPGQRTFVEHFDSEKKIKESRRWRMSGEQTPAFDWSRLM